jgi:hypothetical protein
MDKKELLRFADAWLTEAKTQAEHHAKLANNYRCIATKTRMLRESIEALEDTIRRIGVEKAVFESMQVSEACPMDRMRVEPFSFDFAEFDT